jgi:hypothetical protein
MAAKLCAGSGPRRPAGGRPAAPDAAATECRNIASHLLPTAIEVVYFRRRKRVRRDPR